MKDAAIVLSEPLSHFIHLSLKTGSFAQQWKAAKIIHLHNSGSKANFDNYRPIFLLPMMSKVIEKTSDKQLMNFLDGKNVLSTGQFASEQKFQQD